MMMLNGDERAMRFVRLVEQMQACEMVDMDYHISRLTDDDGSIHYNMEIPDKDVLSLIKRPSRIMLAQPREETGPTVEWKTILDQMRKRQSPQE